MSKVISISNHKGGVGKTTSAINIGAGLNKLGKKILLIDLDPQANLSQSLGLIDQERNIYGALRGEYKLQPIEILKRPGCNTLYFRPLRSGGRDERRGWEGVYPQRVNRAS
jgi:cellulose biosynthesis protein BcsQ